MNVPIDWGGAVPPQPCPFQLKRRYTMKNALIELLIKIEMLKTEDLKKIKTWVDYNLEKRAKELDHE